VRKLLLLILIGLIVFVAVYRQRIYVWDPIATVTRDGVKQGNVRVMINYSNDVLIDDGSRDQRVIYLVQSWNKTAEYSSGPLKCIRFLACMTDADQASGDKLVTGSRGKRDAFEGVTMTNKRVEFVDEHGALVRVMLR
jgi:hypothetical protein